MKRPFLINIPDFDCFQTKARSIFESGTLTTNGPKARELEDRIAEYLGVEHVVLTSSGTLALQIAYRALELEGEIITTPFSWVTTASSMCWVGLKPRFVDIQPSSFNLDPDRIEEAITPQTGAILAVHTFGNPSEIDTIEEIAGRRGLKTVYDCAHAFGTKYKGKSVLAFGDASVLSLQATKLFHAVEGGAVILRDKELYRRALLAANNGLDPEGGMAGLGVNARMSELHAAVGLCLLDKVEEILSRNRSLGCTLRMQLAQSSTVELQSMNADADVNHAYFAMVTATPEQRREVASALESTGFRPRRYCNPPLNRLAFLGTPSIMPCAESLSERLICVTYSPHTSLETLNTITRVVSAICPIRNGPLGASAGNDH
jgi:dTDP-4-amino-4,6-dideoxygalactose transaminase